MMTLRLCNAMSSDLRRTNSLSRIGLGIGEVQCSLARCYPTSAKERAEPSILLFPRSKIPYRVGQLPPTHGSWCNWFYAKCLCYFLVVWPSVDVSSRHMCKTFVPYRTLHTSGSSYGVCLFFGAVVIRMQYIPSIMYYYIDGASIP